MLVRRVIWIFSFGYRTKVQKHDNLAKLSGYRTKYWDIELNNTFFFQVLKSLKLIGIDQNNTFIFSSSTLKLKYLNLIRNL